MKTKCILFLIVLLAHLNGAYAAVNVDSLKTALQKTKIAEEQFDIYFRLSRALASSKIVEAKKYYDQVNLLNKQINTPTTNVLTELLSAIITFEDDDNIKAEQQLKNVIPKLQGDQFKEELAQAYSYLGINYMITGNYLAGIDNFDLSIQIANELNKISLITQNEMYKGRCFESMANATQALAWYQKALITAEKLKDQRKITEINLFIGSLYTEGINDELGMEYLMKAADVAEKMKDTALLINAFTYIANQYYYKKNYQRALDEYEKILSYSYKYGNKHTTAGILGNLGNVYSDMGQTEKGLELQFKAIEGFEALGDKQGLTICYNTVGLDYLKLKQNEQALAYFNKALVFAEEMNSVDDLIEVHENLAKFYEETKDYQKALVNYKLYKRYNDSVYNTSNAQKITEMELSYQFEGKQKEAKLLQELTDERNKRIMYIFISGGLILLIVIFLVARANHHRKKINEQLTVSNNAIMSQKEELETHKKEITDSINYAKRIQESILPPDTYWKNVLPDSFIFYRPKDIVSGDFYWVEQKDDSICFAAVDCTGHGVPGALMSVVGFNLLTQAINEMNLTVPAQILEHLDYGVTKTLRQSGEGTGVKDGMDLSLCTLNQKTNVLQYAGAYNSLYYIKAGVFYEIKADKLPIGVNLDGQIDTYTNHTIPLEKGDCVYLFSDGYADQFGGAKGKKFKYNQLKELLHKNYLLPMEEQKMLLAETFDSWKGDLEQVDDVVIIGVRV